MSDSSYNNPHSGLDGLGFRPGKEERTTAAASEMFELLETIENDANTVPEWLWVKICDVCRRVRGEV